MRSCRMPPTITCVRTVVSVASSHLQFEQAVIQQNALPHFACHVRLGCPAASFDAGRHFLILNRHPSRLADNIIGGEYQLFTGNQRDTPRLHFAHAQFRPLQIDENRYRPVPHLRNLADRVDIAGVKLMIAMAHIDACHIHASVDHLGENLGDQCWPALLYRQF